MQGTLTPPVGKRDHVQGSPSAIVTLVEYGDFQCPFCGDVYPIIKALQKHFGKRLRFVFRHFPRVKIHAFAQRAAEAAEAAGAQGKFWEMHDYLFEHRTEALDFDNLMRAAESIGLDRVKFDRDVAEHAYADRVAADVQSGNHSEATGTPELFIDGRRHDDNDDFETLKSKIEEAIVISRPSKGRRRT